MTLVQRSPTLITNIEPSAQLAYATYNEGTLEDNDLIAASMPLRLAKKTHQMITEQSKQFDKELLDGLAAVGFKLDYGEDDTGWQFKYLTRGGGYYFNVGCSDLVARREIALRQFADIESFVAEGAQMKNGETLAANLIVLATGYKPQEVLVTQLFGEEIAARVGPIWGFGDGQELRNMYTRTGQDGLWFIAGSLAQCRINSKFLALQIKAIEEADCCPRGPTDHRLTTFDQGEEHMPMILGSGEHRYRVVENWAKLPDGWKLTDVASVAVDSKDRVYVFNRGAHPMIVFDRDGNFVKSWGEGLFQPRAWAAHRRA